MTTLRRLTRVLLSLVVLGVCATCASAQYFGRNKVKYRAFDFSVLRTEHFDVYYYEEERQAAESAARMAERWYERLSRAFEHQLSGRQPLILYGSQPAFQQTSVIQGDIGEGTGGVTEASKRRIVLPIGPALAETDHVIGHELVHAFQFDISDNATRASDAPTAQAMPLWFIEGMAEYLSIGAVDPNTAMWMRDAVRANDLPTVARLDDPRYFPYRYGQALWSFVAGRYGENAVAAGFRAATRTPDVGRAIAMVTGVGPDTLSREWHDSLRVWYGRIAPTTEQSGTQARRVIAGSKRVHYNVSPALSPDGRWLVFLSERGEFSIEMYLADARTGRVVRRLTRAALDPHLWSLQFIQSAGSFDAAGKRFAYASVERGRPVLNVYDLDRQRVEKKLKLSGLEEAFHPTWSPDGSRIAFSAQSGGWTDLFVVELASGKLTRLTNDAFAALEPAWSPDGAQLAYVTDAFTTDLAALTYGGYSLATIPATGGSPVRVPGFERAKHMNPQWTRDGRGLYFVSDPDGISNLYQVTLGGGEIRRITNLATGVSGITAISPAISAARATDEVAMSVYERGSFHVDLIADPTRVAGSDGIAGTTAGVATTGVATRVPAATLPPVERRSDLVPAAAGADRAPSAASFRRTDYRARLSLDQVSSLSAGLGVGSGTVTGGGGITLLWSDMLGEHHLLTAAQFSDVGGSFVTGLAGGVGYWNDRRRWGWGGQVSQVPLVAREIVLDEGTIGGVPAVRQRDRREYQIERDVLGQVAYPFSRAMRLELGAGFRQVDFGGEVEERIFRLDTGELVESSVTPLPADSLPSLSMGIGTAALVYDNSYFGGTSPLLGRRYRFEATPVLGDLRFVGALADFRQYVPLIRPLVLAARVYHAARYGEDAENPSLASLFLGYPWLIRGYDSGSFTIDECETGDCEEFDRLLGSRLALANAELRLPLIGPFGLLRTYAVPPIELAGFYDIGAAWRVGEASPLEKGGRDPVSSHGVALRVNLFNFVLETNYVHPNDRPRKGWYWQVNLQPGF